MAMQCPECNSRLYCLETRSWFDGAVRRRYRCSKSECGRRMYTLEMFADENEADQKTMILQYKLSAKKRILDSVRTKLLKVLDDL